MFWVLDGFGSCGKLPPFGGIASDTGWRSKREDPGHAKHIRVMPGVLWRMYLYSSCKYLQFLGLYLLNKQ